MSTGRTPRATPGSTPDQKLSQQKADCSTPRDPSSAAIGSLVGELERIIGALEQHVGEMNYAGTDEFNAGTFSRHPFNDNACDVLHDLADRAQQLSDDLYSIEQERQSYAAMSKQQQLARTEELQQITKDAQADQARRSAWQQGASVREAAWAAMPPEVTASGRYPSSVSRCANCGGRVETVNGVRRCWSCFRRGQDGR